ncbi:MAG: fructose-bisphosphatase class III, partial [Bacteroidales bacterium]|nr:fructose-bisphosphatase class III [Bacteroidales bacterium]
MAKDTKYLELLSQSFPTIQAASSEIINLEAILNLPKGTEHFVTDLHGEYEAFQHILRNASGVIKRKVDELFGTQLLDVEKKELCSLIYYPEEKLKLLKKKKNINEWYRITLVNMVKVLEVVASKYTRSKVRKAMPPEYAYIIDELIHTHYEDIDKRDYYENIISTIVELDRAADFLIQLCTVIKRLAVDHLH